MSQIINKYVYKINKQVLYTIMDGATGEARGPGPCQLLKKPLVGKLLLFFTFFSLHFPLWLLLLYVILCGQFLLLFLLIFYFGFSTTHPPMWLLFFIDYYHAFWLSHVNVLDGLWVKFFILFYFYLFIYLFLTWQR